MPTIRYDIVGDSSSLQSASQNAAKDLGSLEKQGDKTTKGLKGIGKETAHLGDDLLDTTKSTKGLGAGLAGLAGPAAIAAAAIAAVTAAVFKAAQANSEWADTQVNLIKTTGLSAETIGGLTVAAGNAGASMAELEPGIRALVKGYGDAASGSQAAADKLLALGISQDEITAGSKDSNAALRATLDALKALPEGAERSAAAMEVFGSRGAMVAAVLADGSAGLDTYIGQAHDLGAVLTDESAAASAEMDRAMTALNETMGAAVRTVGVEFTPLITETADALTSTVGPLVDLALNLKSIHDALVIVNVPWELFKATSWLVAEAAEAVNSVFEHQYYSVEELSQGYRDLEASILSSFVVAEENAKKSAENQIQITEDNIQSFKRELQAAGLTAEQRKELEEGLQAQLRARGRLVRDLAKIEREEKQEAAKAASEAEAANKAAIAAAKARQETERAVLDEQTEYWSRFNAAVAQGAQDQLEELVALDHQRIEESQAALDEEERLQRERVDANREAADAIMAGQRDLIADHLAGLRMLAQAEGLTAEQREAVNQELHETLEELDDARKEQIQEQVQGVVDAAIMATQTIGDLFGLLAERMGAAADEQQAKIDDLRDAYSEFRAQQEAEIEYAMEHERNLNSEQQKERIKLMRERQAEEAKARQIEIREEEKKLRELRGKEHKAAVAAFRTQQLAAVASIAVNAIDLGIKLAGTIGPIAGPALAATMGVLGAAAVMAQPAPEMKHAGGMIEGYAPPSYAPDEVPIRAQAGEYVVSKAAASGNEQALDALNRTGSMPGGVTQIIIGGRAISDYIEREARGEGPLAGLIPDPTPQPFK